MKRVVKTIAIFLSALLLFSIVGCNRGGGDDGKKPAIADTNIVLAENGVSDYKIVIKGDASPADVFSAEELQTYIKRSTDAELPIVRETEGASLGDKVLSVGRTNLLQGSGVEVP